MSHMSHSTVALVKGQGQLWILSVNTLAIR